MGKRELSFFEHFAQLGHLLYNKVLYDNVKQMSFGYVNFAVIAILRLLCDIVTLFTEHDMRRTERENGTMDNKLNR